jgi:hypothetical protein
LCFAYGWHPLAKGTEVEEQNSSTGSGMEAMETWSFVL